MRFRDTFERHPALTLVSVLLVVFLILDVGSKNIVKAYGKYLLRRNDHEHEYRIRSTIYHHDLKPMVNIPQTAWGGFFYPLATNSLGFKDSRPREISLPATRPRILFLGDSFTEGIGVDFASTFAGIVAAQYDQQGIEVLNAAVASYSPSIYFAKAKYLLETVGLQFAELVVFIDISDIGDEFGRYDLQGEVVVDASAERVSEYQKIADAMAAQKKERRSAYLRVEQIVCRDSIVTCGVVKWVHDQWWGRALAADEAALNLAGTLWTVDRQLHDAYAKVGLAEGREAMERLQALCERHGVKLTIAVYPVPDQIFHDDLHSAQVAFWSQWAGEHGVRVIDFFPDFIVRPYSEARAREMLDAYFLPGDVHWNKNGHRKIAEVFLAKFTPERAAAEMGQP